MKAGQSKTLWAPKARQSSRQLRGSEALQDLGLSHFGTRNNPSLIDDVVMVDEALDMAINRRAHSIDKGHG